MKYKDPIKRVFNKIFRKPKKKKLYRKWGLGVIPGIPSKGNYAITGSAGSNSSSSSSYSSSSSVSSSSTHTTSGPGPLSMISANTRVFHSTGSDNPGNPSMSEYYMKEAILNMASGRYILIEVGTSLLPELEVIMEGDYITSIIITKIKQAVDQTFTLQELKEQSTDLSNIFIKINSKFDDIEWRLTMSTDKNFHATQQIEKLKE